MVTLLSLFFMVPAAWVQLDSSPMISELRVSPNVGYPGTKVRIQLSVHDPQGLNDVEQTLYLIVDGSGEITIRIYDDGTNGDSRAGDGEFIGKMEIPPNVMLQRHEFVVYLFDRAGNRSNTLTFDMKILSRGQSA